MLLADARTKALLDQLTPQVQATLASLADRTSANFPVQQLLANTLLRQVNRVFGLSLDAKEMRRWVKFEVEHDHILIKVDHNLMMQYQDETPEWVYGLLWSFYPGYAPTFKNL